MRMNWRINKVVSTLFPKYWEKHQINKEKEILKDPKKWFEKSYRKMFGKSFDWNHPRTLIDKQRWLMFNTDISKWTLLADKFAVREYVSKLGYADNLIPLLAKWDKAEDIDFSSLPNEFVLKTNHGSHDYMVISDKSKVYIDKVRNFYKEHLAIQYGIESCEIQYWNIKPCVIAEKLMRQDGNFSKTLVDYKFYVFHGIPDVCAVFFNRDYKENSSSYQLYDMNWVLKDVSNGHEPIDIPRPKTLDQMIGFCSKACKEFPFVRMDFYEIEGKMYVGEFTFTPCALTPASQVFNKERMLEWGEKMDLSGFKK